MELPNICRVITYRATNSGGAGQNKMSKVTYKIVQHDGGWAYQVSDVFSETFPTHDAALKAAQRAAAEQRVPGTTEVIEWEDADGKWHSETAPGRDRPETEVQDPKARR